MGCGASQSKPAGQSTAQSSTSAANQERSSQQETAEPAAQAKKQELEPDEIAPFDDSKIVKVGSQYVVEVDDISVDQGVKKCKHKSKGYAVTLKEYAFRQLEDANQKALADLLPRVEKMRHANIVCYLWSEYDASDLKVYREFCGGHSLKRLLTMRKEENSDFSEDELRRHLRHMALGLAYIHENNIIHRNVRPEAIFISEHGVAKIADFLDGSMLSTNESLRRTVTGDANYIAPEMLMDLPYKFSVDTWALGIVLHEMATFKVPFANMWAIPKVDDPDFLPLRDNCSAGLRQLGKKMLTVNLDLRPTAAQIADEVFQLP